MNNNDDQELRLRFWKAELNDKDNQALAMHPLPEPAFQLFWLDNSSTYKVSKPKIGDTDVYTAEQLEAYAAPLITRIVELEAKIAKLRDALDLDDLL